MPPSLDTRRLQELRAGGLAPGLLRSFGFLASRLVCRVIVPTALAAALLKVSVALTPPLSAPWGATQLSWRRAGTARISG